MKRPKQFRVFEAINERNLLVLYHTAAQEQMFLDRGSTISGVW